MNLIPRRATSRVLFVVLALTASTWSAAEGPPPVQANELVRRVVANEINATNHSAKCMFRQRKETPNGSQTKLMVETRDAMVGMVVAYNDRPLNRDERRGEDTRIQRFIDNPQELERKHLLPCEHLMDTGYVDAQERVLCRLDVRQAEFSKVTADTANVPLIVEGTSSHAPEMIRRAFNEVIDLVTHHCGGKAEIVAQAL